MQQLTLFTGSSSRETGLKKRSNRIHNRARPQQASRWDLFEQATEPEKEMALLFLDIRNFTPLAEKHPAFDVIHIIKKLFSTFQNIIRIHHGRVIETNGDGLYAAFGFQPDIRKAVNEAVHAGRAILKMLEYLNTRTFEPNMGQRIEVGIGIHAGKVATGNLQIGQREHLVVMGYAVNIASRIQATTRVLNNNFVVSSEIYDKLDNVEVRRDPVTVNLKGAATSYTVYPIGCEYLEAAGV